MKPITLSQLLPDLTPVSTSNVGTSDEVKRIVIDSRIVKQGDLFFAIRGENQDGHDYIQEALKKGAVAVVAQDDSKLNRQWPIIKVSDTTLALGLASKWYRLQFDSLTIGITGSVGKTTTRNLVHAVLSEQFKGTQSQKNYNNQWGVPLSLFEMNDDSEYAVVELGASRAGEIGYLADLVSPEIGIITAIGPAHLETFGSLSTIIQTKAELFQSLPETGLAIYSADDLNSLKLARYVGSRSLTVGWSDDNDLTGEYRCVKNGSSSFILEGHEFKLPFAGKHLAHLAMYAAAVGFEIGMNINEIKAGLMNYKAEVHRQQIHHTSQGTIIDDCYNASPLSVKSACNLLREWQTEGNRYLVLGSMMGLGEATKALHQDVGNYVAQPGIQYFYAYGPHAQDLITGAKRGGMSGGQLGHFENLEALSSLLSFTLNPEDVLLIKGSRAMKMEKLVDTLLTDIALSNSQVNKLAA